MTLHTRIVVAPAQNLEYHYRPLDLTLSRIVQRIDLASAYEEYFQSFIYDFPAGFS